jgi:predicted ArsR family transcriptional regulator
MKSTRQRLLDLLEKQQTATASELSRALQVTEADVRHHLAALRRAGTVASLEEDGQAGRPAGRGRPARRYRLAERALEDNYEALAGALLDEVLAREAAEARTTFLKRIAARLAGGAQPEGSLAKRLVQAAQRLNELHYQARWEARPGAPQVTLGRCPYAALLPEHPELCQMDAALLEALLGAPVIQTEKLARDARGATYCRFAVGGTRGEGRKG